MNDEANLSIVVALARWLALIGVLVWALTSKDGDGKGTETSQTTNGGSNNKNNGGYIEVPRGDSNGNSGDDSYVRTVIPTIRRAADPRRARCRPARRG